MLADKMRDVLDTGAEVVHGGRQLVPDAHRRRRCAAQRAGVRADAPGRDPRATRGAMTHRQPASRAAAARAALADAQLRAQPRQRDAHDPRQARRASSAEVPDWEELREAGRGDQGRARCATLDELPRASSRRRSTRARRASCTGRATPPRRTRSSRGIVAGHGARRGRQGQVAGDRRDRAQRGARGARASQAIETDLAELIVQLADDASVAHPRAGDPQEPRRDPRAVRAHARARPGSRPTTRGELAEAARRHLREKFLARARWRSAARTSPSPRPARSASSSPRATGGCA